MDLYACNSEKCVAELSIKATVGNLVIVKVIVSIKTYWVTRNGELLIV